MVRLTPAQLPIVEQAVADAARRYFASGTMSFPAEALNVSGRKPGHIGNRQPLSQPFLHHRLRNGFQVDWISAE
jgi:hypothetical protein